MNLSSLDPLTFLLLRIELVILVLMDDEGRVLLLSDAHVVARIVLLHDVPWSRIQQNRVLVKLWQLGRTDTDQSHSVSDKKTVKISAASP